MELSEALKRVEEICTGDKEKEAFDAIVNGLEAYRSLYEGAEKRLMRYRDIAAKPDLCIATYNKDRFTDRQTAFRMFEAGVSGIVDEKSFSDWLFERFDDPVISADANVSLEPCGKSE